MSEVTRYAHWLLKCSSGALTEWREVEHAHQASGHPAKGHTRFIVDFPVAEERVRSPEELGRDD